MKLKNLLEEATVFHRHHRLASVSVWLFAGLVSAALSFPHTLSDAGAFVVWTVAAAGVVFQALLRYDKALESRIHAGGQGPRWQVRVNGVTVGQLDDADYAAMRRAIFLDGRTYVAQLLNLGSVLGKAVDRLVWGVPVGFFWLAAGCFVFAPDMFSQAVSVWHKVTPPQALAAIPTLLQLLVLVAIFDVGFHAFLGRDFAFINRFDLACDARVRRAVGGSVDGDVFLYRVVENELIVSNELECFRRPKSTS